jgi:hypothetical protein
MSEKILAAERSRAMQLTRPASAARATYQCDAVNTINRFRPAILNDEIAARACERTQVID